MSFWGCVQTIATREQPVAERLRRVGYEVIAPQARFRVFGKLRIQSVFPGYLFLRIISEWYPARWTDGVLRILMAGDVPANVPSFEIEKIIRQTGPNGLVRVPKNPPIAPRTTISEGAQVRILTGNFRGIHCIFAGMTADERLRVLVDLLGRKVSVELARDDRVEILDTPKVLQFQKA